MRNTFKLALPYSTNSSAIAARFRDLDLFVWLDSGYTPGKLGMDIITALPSAILTEDNGTLRLRGEQDIPVEAHSLKSILGQLLPAQSEANSLFDGGLVGYLSYDFSSKLIPLAQGEAKCSQPSATPALQVGLYEWAIVFNHAKLECTLLIRPECPAAIRAIVMERIAPDDLPSNEQPFALTALFTEDQPRSRYQDSFKRIQEYIQAGDCYQINYAQRFSSHYKGDPWAAYLTLRRQANAPFSAFIRTPSGAVLSFSPEQFIQIQGDHVSTSPIKGTRPRGKSPEDDTRLARELSESQKDRAENVMIVDLLRNDLSLHAETGSVTVEKLFELQSFHNVHHLVSTIRARKRHDAQALEVFLDAFPGGSITGAPKRRAMEIIAELEPHPRSVYCGSIFWCSRAGNLNSNIAIRTLVCEQGRIYCWGGGGIVADSEESIEYQETLNKIRLFMTTLETEFLEVGSQ